MQRWIAFLWLIPTGLAAACDSPGESGGGVPFATAPELLAADEAFAAAAAERGADAWQAVWAENGVRFGTNGEFTVGPHAVATDVSGLADAVRREPQTSGTLWPGQLGYTTGRWWLNSGTVPTGSATRRYLTVWQRIGSHWRVALDLPLPPAAADSRCDFDFWLGDWQIKQRIWTGNGDQFETYTAKNRVRKLADGALVESFTGSARFFWFGMDGPAPVRGASIRVYNAESRQWQIFWMDSQGLKFDRPFGGHFSGNVGEFFVAGESDRPPRRIRFERRENGSVAWQLAMRTADTHGWQSLWTMEFRRRGDD